MEVYPNLKVNHDQGSENALLAEKDKTIGLVRELCQELNVRQVDYCHWKSNAALRRSAAGENDLDLLVSREHVGNFNEILNKLGFKQTREQFEYSLPGVISYYGYDREADKIIHVHAHFQLIFGHDATKNYHLPVEGPYLASSHQEGLFKVPSAEFELIILVIRLMVKHFTWDTFLLHQGRLSIFEKNELDYLVQRASQTGLETLLKKYLPFIPLELFKNCLHSLQTKTSTWKRIAAGSRLQACLEAYSRRPYSLGAILKIWRRFAWPFRVRILRQKEINTLSSGGLLIAIVGGDGAGKTTAVDAVTQWLSEYFEVTRFHMGKPRWSFLTILVRGLIKVGRSLGLYPFMRSEIQYTDDKEGIVFPGYPWMIRELCTARDRYLTYVQARRLATNGRLVILDRFPLPQIKFMDGPQIDWLTCNLSPNRLIHYLSGLEKGYYLPFIPPDILVVLRVDPEIAVQRKVDEIEEEVRARSNEVWKIDWSQTSALVIDARRPKEEVLSEVKWQIWSRM